MTTPPDDLEEKVDVLLENIKLKEQFSELAQQNKISTSAYQLAHSLRLAEYDSVIKQAQKMIDKDNSNYFAFYYQGLAFRSQQKNTPAIEAFSKAIKVKPLAEFYLERGITFTTEKKWAPAIQDYQKARELKSGSIDVQARSHFFEGRTWQMQGNSKRAI